MPLSTSIHILEPPPKRSRVRHQRSNTGCKDCRQRRVKCPEGAIDSRSGLKIACGRCWETGTACYYPAPAASQKRSKLLRDVVWVEAAPGDEDRACPSSDDNEHFAHFNCSASTASSSSSSGSQRQPYQSSSPVAQRTGTTQSSLYDLPPITQLFQFNVDPNTLPTTGRQATVLTSSSTFLSPETENSLDLSFMLDPTADLSLPSFLTADASPEDDTHQTSTQLMTTSTKPSRSVSTPTNMFAPFLQSDLIKKLFKPSPRGPVSSFTLSAFPSGTMDRTVLSYFESQGCNEIVSAPSEKTNWIYSRLFPQVYHLLSTIPSSKTGPGMIRDYVYHCLMQLSFIHKGNVERDAGKAGYWKSEARKHRSMASLAVLKVKALKDRSGWKTEEYLMGFFIRCMADMLDSRDLIIDHTTAFELPIESSSSSYPDLRDMIALYSTISDACTPLEVASARCVLGPTKPLFELSLPGGSWVESFVGYSRQSIVLLGRVNGMVVYRDRLIRDGRESGPEGQALRAQAEALSVELANPYAWEEPGKSRRVETGSMVLRLALMSMVLSELLEIDLKDLRYERPRMVVQELVADTFANELAGYQWCLTVLAVYTNRNKDREMLSSLMDESLSLSFGTSYQGAREIMDMCWEVYDAQGFYTNGIAPWREAMTAFGRTIVV